MACRPMWAAVMALVLPAAFSPAAARDMQRCDQLAASYDRYSGRVSEGRMPVGRLERELGYQECRKGNVAEGVRLLEQAIRRSGYNVPPE